MRNNHRPISHGPLSPQRNSFATNLQDPHRISLALDASASNFYR